MVLRLFEFEDFAWVPRSLRNGVTDYLSFLIHYGRLYEPAVALLSGALKRMDENTILDCCTGAGGPWVDLYPALQSRLHDFRLSLCDYFPNREVEGIWNSRFPSKARYIASSVDATNIPAGLKGFRTFFSSFHHFSPEQGRQILQDAVRKQTGIALFECTQRRVWVMASMLFFPPMLLLLTPFIRPFTWKRLFFTYLLPMIPFFCAWDGLVSCLRTYSLKEMQQMTDSLLGSETYEWQIGEANGPLSPVPITYLIGIPRSRLNVERSPVHARN